MKLTCTLLTCDRPSPYTGRIFPLEEVQKMVDEYNKQPNRFGVCVRDQTRDIGASIPLEDFSHVVNSLSIVDGDVVADITLMDTPAGNYVKEVLHSVRLSPAMTGNVDIDTFQASDLQLIRTDFIPDIKEEPK